MGKLVTITNVGILANLVAFFSSNINIVTSTFQATKQQITKTDQLKARNIWQIAILQIYWCVIKNGYHLTVMLQVKIKSFREKPFLNL